MTLSLAPHVHLAVLGDDIVLLDVGEDAYMCVPDGVAQLRPSADRSRLRPRGKAAHAALLEAGLVHTAGAAPARARLRRPTLDLGDAAPAPLSLGEALRLGGALWDLVWRYRGRSLGQILAFVTRPEASALRGDGAEVVRLAAVFQRVVVWLPLPRKCLVRSFVLLRFLQRSGLGAQWVFGVTTWPFGAHCWLQLGDIALDDHPERIVEYEPILRVGGRPRPMWPLPGPPHPRPPSVRRAARKNG